MEAKTKKIVALSLLGVSALGLAYFFLFHKGTDQKAGEGVGARKGGEGEKGNVSTASRMGTNLKGAPTDLTHDQVLELEKKINSGTDVEASKKILTDAGYVLVKVSTGIGSKRIFKAVKPN